MKLQFADRRDNGCSIFNFASKFSQSWFFGPNFACINENFLTKRFFDNFSTAKNLGWTIVFSTTPLVMTAAKAWSMPGNF